MLDQFDVDRTVLSADLAQLVNELAARRLIEING